MYYYRCMEHIAIMKKSWGLTEKILSGEKKIESRWYKNKSKPWDAICRGETIYFKNSGEPVTIKATVEKVLQFSELSPIRVKEILDKFGKDDGISKDKLPQYKELFKDKKYCLLIYLKNVERVNPFNIDKTGFGAMSAWISVNHVTQIVN